MLKVIINCGNPKCNKETLSSDINGVFTVDFLSRQIKFICPKCNKESCLDLDFITKSVENQKSKAFPGIGKSNF